jgi:pimeloyl-ACP methyl ester carboxylesterase
MKKFCTLLVATVALVAHAELLQIPTGRGDKTFPVYWERTVGATATVVLLAGGDGQVKFAADGKPRGNNFLIRTWQQFATQKLNVAVVGTVDDVPLSYEFRISDDHTSDLATVATTVRGLSAVPVWLVGTSRGTISAAATAIRYDGKKLIDGIVLSSAVVGYKRPEAVSRQSIDKIHIPVLVYMHTNDGCVHCQWSDATAIGRKFKNAPVYGFMAISGGTEPSGDPCGSQHYHGFIGMEGRAVTDIVNWINRPTAQ